MFHRVRASVFAQPTGVVLALLVGALATLPARAQSIRIDGAGAGYALSKLAAGEFQKFKKNEVRLTLGTSGSAGGLRKLCRNEIDIANAARPILKEESVACLQARVEFIELPLAFDAITVVVNAQNGFVSSLTLDELRRMWEAGAQGKIVRWNQVKSRFPNQPLKLLGPDTQFEQASTFNEAVLGRGAQTRRDYMTSVSDHVLAQGVARDVNALSYVPYGTYLENRQRLKAVQITHAVGDAAPGAPSRSGAGQVLSRPVFMYVNAKSLENASVREFLEFFLANGSRFASAARYLPLADATYRLNIEHLRRGSKGTAWGGTIPLGLTSEELQKRQAAL